MNRSAQSFTESPAAAYAWTTSAGSMSVRFRSWSVGRPVEVLQPLSGNGIQVKLVPGLGLDNVADGGGRRPLHGEMPARRPRLQRRRVQGRRRLEAGLSIEVTVPRIDQLALDAPCLPGSMRWRGVLSR